MARRNTGRFPAPTRRLDRNPLRRQVPARGPPALLSALPASVTRRQTQQSPSSFIFAHVDRPIRPFADPADAPAHVPLIGLCRAVAVQSDADQRPRRQSADESAPPP